MLRAALLAGLVQGVVVIALVAGLAPGSGRRVVGSGLTAVNLVPPPPPSSPPQPPPRPRPAAGASAAAGKRAVARPVRGAVLAVTPVVTASGDDNRSGARDAGLASGAGGAGAGTGLGASGSGAGGGRAVKLAGEIAERDYPKAGRAARLGQAVTVVLTVSAQGRVTACRVRDPSPDAQADAITCRLAQERFRFRPATDAAGNPVESQFGWRQRWFA